MSNPSPEILKWTFTHAIPALRYYAQHDPGGEASKALVVYPGTLQEPRPKVTVSKHKPTYTARFVRWLGIFK